MIVIIEKMIVHIGLAPCYVILIFIRLSLNWIYYRMKVMSVSLDLLISNPEQEQELLSRLVRFTQIFSSVLTRRLSRGLKCQGVLVEMEEEVCRISLKHFTKLIWFDLNVLLWPSIVYIDLNKCT